LTTRGAPRPTLGWIAGLAVIAAVAVLTVGSAALPTWLAQAAIVLLGLVFMGRAVATRQIAGHTPADWPLLALLLLLPVGLWASPDLTVTLPRAYALIAAAALFWLAAALRGQPWLEWSGWALLAAGLALAFAVLAATPFPGSLPGLPLDVAALQARLPASFLAPDRFNPNLSGSLMALFLAPALALVLAGRDRPQRLAAAGVSALLAVLLLLTQSRGALLGVALAAVVITVLADRRWLTLWGPLALAGLGFGLFALRDGSQMQAELSAALLAGGSEVTATAQGRLELWSRALYLMQDFPFTGVGLGMPERVINLLYPLFTVGPDSQWVHVHNTFLQIGSEMGIPGLIALAALLLAVGAALVRQARNRQAGVYRGLALGLLGSLIVFAVHSLVDAPLASPKLMVLFFGLLGLMSAVAASGGVETAAE
jgi:putative inorganic carbon (HCO3(-)) transporter